jgi:hypothetical protein
LINIVSIKGQPVPEVVEALELSLEDAKQGLIRNIAIVGEGSENNSLYTCFGVEDSMVLVGLLERVKIRILMDPDFELGDG